MKSITSAEQYYALLDDGVILTKKFLESLDFFQVEVKGNLKMLEGQILSASASDYKLYKGFAILVDKAIFDAKTYILQDYAEKLSDLSLLIETQESMKRENDV